MNEAAGTGIEIIDIVGVGIIVLMALVVVGVFVLVRGRRRAAARDVWTSAIEKVGGTMDFEQHLFSDPTASFVVNGVPGRLEVHNMGRIITRVVTPLAAPSPAAVGFYPQDENFTGRAYGMASYIHFDDPPLSDYLRVISTPENGLSTVLVPEIRELLVKYREFFSRAYLGVCGQEVEIRLFEVKVPPARVAMAMDMATRVSLILSRPADAE